MNKIWQYCPFCGRGLDAWLDCDTCGEVVAGVTSNELRTMRSKKYLSLIIITALGGALALCFLLLTQYKAIASFWLGVFCSCYIVEVSSMLTVKIGKKEPVLRRSDSLRPSPENVRTYQIGCSHRWEQGDHGYAICTECQVNEKDWAAWTATRSK